jgi:hypothetical protein
MEIIVTYKSHEASIFGTAVVGISTTVNEGIVVGMKISPCFPFPFGATINDIVSNGSNGLNVKLVDPPAIEFGSYKVNLFEPESSGPAIEVDLSVSLSSGLVAKVRIIEDVILTPSPIVVSALAVADLAKDGKVNLSVILSSYSTATANLKGFTTFFEASLSSQSSGVARLSGFAELFSSSLFIQSSAKADLVGIRSLSGVTLCTIVRDALNLWGIENICHAPDFAVSRAIDDVNAAMQTVWNEADERDYWTKSSSTVTFALGVTSMPLSVDIQNVVGPCRLQTNKRQLAIVRNISELENFMDIFMDGQSSDEPIAYFVERMNQAGDDPVKMVMHITPAPIESTAILLDVVLEAPRYYVHDLAVCPILPIPHRYAESLLLPIVRYKASSFWLFENHEVKPSIDRDYQMAMAAIGAADPLPGKPIEPKTLK